MTSLASELNLTPEPAAGNQTRALRDPIPPDAHGWWWGTGRRKTAVARCRARVSKEGEGTVKIQINRKSTKTVEDYFSEEQDRNDVYAPLKLTELEGNLDVIFRINGGGTTGQAQAARLAIARALVGYDPTTENALRDAGYLTRDSRKVERKKYGQPGARKRFQFSKR
ncbi:MAG: 30S ribosomal protein S9 [Planctomycetota bacterium]|nr:30S ribosomal protein S9 [Planctomycetota bacterium]